MKIAYLFIFIMLLMVSSVSAALTVQRESPVQRVNPGSAFTLRYKTIGGEGEGYGGKIVENVIEGSCTPTRNLEFVMRAANAGSHTTQMTFTAPSSQGICKFKGEYVLSIGEGEDNEVFEGTISEITVNIEPTDEPECTKDSDCDDDETCEDGECVKEDDKEKDNTMLYVILGFFAVLMAAGGRRR